MTGITLRRFDADRQGIEALAHTDEVRELLEDTARAVAAEAPRFAPQRGWGGVARHYEPLGAEETRDGWVAYAGSPDPFSIPVEFGTYRQPPYRPLTRAVERLGLRFDPA